MEPTLGFAHFLSQADAAGKTVLGLLLLLSMASWYLIVTKLVQQWRMQRRAGDFLRRFWDAPSLAEAEALVNDGSGNNAFGLLAREAIKAAAQAQRQDTQKLALAGGLGEYLTRVLRREVDQETARVEHGLTVLASAGSAAPYIGLFGTVWGIYHALVQIGLAGQGTLDKVAGPVGEALVMTALGLAVAIPAVLAFNFFSRRNRVWLADLDAFAHDLLNLLTMGEAKTDTSAEREAPRLRAAVAGSR